MYCHPNRRPPIPHGEVVQVSCRGEELGRLASHAGGPHATSGRHLVWYQHGKALAERQQTEAG